MIKNYIKTMWRGLVKNRTFSFLNIGGLAIGIVCASLIFLWVEDEVTFDNANVKKDNLYALRVNFSYAGTIYTNTSTPKLMAPVMQKEIPGIANTCRTSDQNQDALFSMNDKAIYASGLFADSTLFKMFSFFFVEGNAQTAFGQLKSLVISQSTAKKFFGDVKSVVGKTVRMDNKNNYVVTGVVKDLPENSTLQFEWVAPMENAFLEGSYNGGWDSYGPVTYVELMPSANLANVNKHLFNFIHQKDATQKTNAFLFPMRDWHLRADFDNGKQTGGGRIDQVHTLSAIAWIILFIACINFMNLSTARSEKRAREVGVRKVMGATKKGLIAQFIGEALFMALLSAVIALVIIILVLPAFNELVQKGLSLGLDNPAHLLGLFAITLICGLVAGSYPSLYLSSFNPTAVLKGLKLKTGNTGIIRKGLVVVQFTVSVVFILSTIVIYLQLQHVKSRNLGFNKDNLVEINFQTTIGDKFSYIKQDLLQTGIIENAATANHSTVYGGDTDNSFKWQGKAVDNDVSIAFRNVSAEYVATSGMHIADGTDFITNTSPNNTDVIINKSLAKIMGKGSAVGKIIQSSRGQAKGVFQNLTVVGVVDDYIFGNMYGEASPVLLFCRPPEYGNLIYARIKPNTNAEKAIAAIETVMKKDNPAYPFQYRFVDDQFNQKFSNEALMSKIAGLFATLAIVISCLGLFGLAAYTTERRIREIGIRKVLGASVTGLAALLSKDFMQLVGLSCLISFPVSGWMMHNWLQQYQYRIGITWWMFLMVGALAIAIALITISFQAIKAALANPVRSLRSE